MFCFNIYIGNFIVEQLIKVWCWEYYNLTTYITYIFIFAGVLFLSTWDDTYNIPTHTMNTLFFILFFYELIQSFKIRMNKTQLFMKDHFRLKGEEITPEKSVVVFDPDSYPLFFGYVDAINNFNFVVFAVYYTVRLYLLVECIDTDAYTRYVLYFLGFVFFLNGILILQGDYHTRKCLSTLKFDKQVGKLKREKLDTQLEDLQYKTNSNANNAVAIDKGTPRQSMGVNDEELPKLVSPTLQELKNDDHHNSSRASINTDTGLIEHHEGNSSNIEDGNHAEENHTDRGNLIPMQKRTAFKFFILYSNWDFYLKAAFISVLMLLVTLPLSELISEDINLKTNTTEIDRNCSTIETDEERIDYLLNDG